MAESESTAAPTQAAPQPEPSWPDHGNRSVVFLLDAATPLEEKILRDWIEPRTGDNLGGCEKA